MTQKTGLTQEFNWVWSDLNYTHFDQNEVKYKSVFSRAKCWKTAGRTPSPCAGWPHCAGMGRVRAAWGSVVSHSSHNSTLINSRRSVSALLSNPSSLGQTAQSGFTCTCQDALSFLIHLPAQTSLHWVPVIHTPISTCKSPAPPCLSVWSVRLFNIYLNHNKNIFFTKKLRGPWSSYLETEYWWFFFRFYTSCPGDGLGVKPINCMV